MFDPRVLNALACPACLKKSAKDAKKSGRLKLEGAPEAPTAFKCIDCGHVYPLIDGIPNFVIK